MRLAAVSALLGTLGILAGTRAAEAIFPDGRRLSGELAWERDSRLHFLAAGQGPLLLSQVEQVRFSAATVPPLRAAALHRLGLSNGDYLTGQFLSLDEQNVHFQSGWAGRLTVPRRAVRAVMHAPGFVTFFQDDFENGLRAWRLSAGPADEAPALSARRHVSGRQSLRLGKPGQAAEYVLAAPLAAGRAGINFHDPGSPAGGRWLVRAEFGSPAGVWQAETWIAGACGHYQASVSAGTPLERRAVRRSPGWHRLSIEFPLQSLLVAVDEDLLWFGRRPRPGSALRKLSLVCEPAGEDTSGGEVFFDDLGLARAVNPLPRPQEDPGQDELWLLDGDQVFGSVNRAGPHAITLLGRLGPGTLAWGQVRGIYFRRQKLPARKPEGERVRLWLRSGAGFEPDQLRGTVRQFNEQGLLLYHEVLGPLAIDRKRLERLWPLAEPLE